MNESCMMEQRKGVTQDRCMCYKGCGGWYANCDIKSCVNIILKSNN